MQYLITNTAVKALAGTALLLASLFSFSVAQAATTIVSGDTSAGENQPGWLFNRDTNNDTPYEFNHGAASIGVGSLYVLPIGANAADKFIAENFINTAIADVETISYDFKIGAGGDASDENEFYMNVYANFGVSDDLKFYDCRYNIVPTVGSTGDFTTVTFDPNGVYPVFQRGGASASPFTCPASPADMDDSSAGSNIRMFALNVGDTSTNDLDLDGYLDNVVVTLTSGMTVSDFDPVPLEKEACMKGGYADFGFKNQGQCIRFVETGKDSR